MPNTYVIPEIMGWIFLTILAMSHSSHCEAPSSVSYISNTVLADGIEGLLVGIQPRDLKTF